MLINMDIDDTLADFSGYILKVYNYNFDKGNRLYKKRLSKNDLTSDLETAMGKEAFEDAFYNCMADELAILNLDIISGAKEFISALKIAGHRILFTTAPSFKYKCWVDQRREWLIENFNCEDKNMCFVHDKNLIKADILIDDRPKYLNAWADGTGKPCIRMCQPWNKDASGILANNFDEALSIIDQIKFK